MRDVSTEEGEPRVALDGYRAGTGLCVIADDLLGRGKAGGRLGRRWLDMCADAAAGAEGALPCPMRGTRWHGRGGGRRLTVRSYLRLEAREKGAHWLPVGMPAHRFVESGLRAKRTVCSQWALAAE